MRKLIKADLRRILRKKAIWILLILIIIVLPIRTISGLGNVSDEDFAFALKVADGINLFGIVLGLILVLNVYADDFNATTYINTIGRGLSRTKYIMAKFLVVMIVAVAFYMLEGLLAFGLTYVAGVHLNSDEVLIIVCRCVADIVSIASSVAITSVFFFLTENATLGVLVYLAIVLIIPVAIELVIALPFVQKIHLDRYYMTGALSMMTSDFIMGMTLQGILVLLATIVVYVGIAIAASIIVFRKKELDF